MEMKKKYILPVVISILLLTMVGIGQATAPSVAFRNPTTSDTLTGSVVLNISLTQVGGEWNDTLSNCTVTATSSRTGGSQSVTLYNYSLAGEGIAYANATVETADGTWQNAEDWSFTATCVNESDDVITVTAATGVDVDNSNPVVLSLTAIGKQTSTFQTVTANIANATSWTCYNALNTVTTGTVAYSFTGTSVTCKFDLQDGNNSYNITAYDGISYGGTKDTYDLQSGAAITVQTGKSIPTQQPATDIGEAEQQVQNWIQRLIDWIKSLFGN